MILSRTPFRISFFGGGTDYPAWYSQHGGAVVAAAINHYCYLSCRRLPPFFEHRYRLAYSQLETTRSVDEIKHPAIRACLQHMQVPEGLEIHHDSDLPKQSGLGTSSSFAVGMLHALHRMRGESPSALQLAEEAIHVERVLCGENVGSQDQVTAAFGGLNRISFGRDGSLGVTPLALPDDRRTLFNQHLMLFFTGFSRIASDVVVEQLQNLPQRERQLREMGQMVDHAIDLLKAPRNSLADFGRLMHEGWQLKRSLSSRISNGEIDEAYETARRHGALGGKLCGAGGGGFLLLFAEPAQQAAIRLGLSRLLHVPFEFDFTGSQIIFEG